MKIKPIYLAIGAGALLFLSKKKSPKEGQILKAAALATANATTEAMGSKGAAAQKAELKIMGDILVPDKAGEPPFGPMNLPTPDEFATLWAVDPDLIKRSIPAESLKPIMDEVKASPELYARVQGVYSAEQRLAMGLSLMSPSQTRNFAADCLQLALPVFEREFPGNPAAAKLIQAIRLMAQRDPSMNAGKLHFLREQVVGTIGKTPKPSMAAFRDAATLAAIVPNDYSRLEQAFPVQVKEKMVAALQKTAEATRKTLRRDAKNQTIHQWEKENPFDPKTNSRKPKYGNTIETAEDLLAKTARAEERAGINAFDSMLSSLKKML